MIYWLHEKGAGYEDWQVQNALEEGRLTEGEYTLIDDVEWEHLRTAAEEQNKQIVNDPSTNQPVLQEIVIPREEILRQELYVLESWFSAHSYIAEKIAYGRATREEYADVISQMDGKAERINEIRAELKAIGGNS